MFTFLSVDILEETLGNFLPIIRTLWTRRDDDDDFVSSNATMFFGCAVQNINFFRYDNVYNFFWVTFSREKTKIKALVYSSVPVELTGYDDKVMT